MNDIKPRGRRTFRELAAEKLLNCLTSAMEGQDPESKGNSVLVVDYFSLGVVNALLSHHELIAAGFFTVCPFETRRELKEGKRRRRYENLDALYLVRPTKSNLERVCEDFKREVEEEEKDLFERLFPCIFSGIPDIISDPPMYRQARLLFLPGPQVQDDCPNWQFAHQILENLIDSRKEYAPLADAWHKTPMHECPVEFLAYESSLFSVDIPDAMSKLYSHRSDFARDDDPRRLRHLDKHIDLIAHRLMTTLVCLEEDPSVRYSSTSSEIPRAVAESLVRQMRRYREFNQSFRPHGHSRSRNRRSSLRDDGSLPEPATVIIVDRVDDLAPALLHDTGYGSLVVDLLGHEYGIPFRFSYTRKSGERVTRDVLLEESSDPVWRLLRYEDMTTVEDSLDEGVRAANARADMRAEMAASGRNNMADMRAVIASLATDEQLVSDKLAQHYRMKSRIYEIFESRGLPDLVVLEQTLVTGCDTDGGHLSSKSIEASVRDLLASEFLDTGDRIRLIALYILCAKSIDTRTRNELMSVARLSDVSRRMVYNLVDLNVPLTRTSTQPRPEGAPFFDSDTIKRNKRMATLAKGLSRYVPKVEDMARTHLAGSLPEDLYPYVSRPHYRNSAYFTPDPKNLDIDVAMHGAHGETVNRFTSHAATASVDTSNVRSGATKRSKFTKSAPTASSALSSKRSGANDTENDALSKFLEPPKDPKWQGGRLIVFVVGGVTILEAAALDRLSKELNREIIVGGTSIVTSHDFLDELEALDPGDMDNEGFGPDVDDMIKSYSINDY